MSKTCLITGVTGQIASYLSDLLLSKGYKVYGLKRRNSSNDFGHVKHLIGYTNFEIVEGDLLDLASLQRIIQTTKPHEIYNCAAQSHVGISFKEPIHTAQATGLGVLNLLEAIRLSGIHSKFLQLSTSEMFGGSSNIINEESPFRPRSPYASAKVFAHHSVVNYRESYNLFACCAICFNNSSPRRGEQFATRKITKSVAEIKLGLRESFSMGNLDTFRDESNSKDIVNGLWSILQQPDPQEFVLGSGTTTSIRSMVDYVCSLASLDPQVVVKIDPNLYRPSEVQCLIADASKARKELGWVPQYTWQDTLKEMYEYDLQNSH